MLAFFIARRHLFSQKSHTVINLIAGVSGVAMAVPVMALVVILSFHNGLSDFIDQMYSEFDSEVRITPRAGGMFRPGEELLRQIQQVPEVEAVSQVVEQHVLVTYASDRQWVAVMRGVDSTYERVVDIASRVVYGEYLVRHGDLERAVVGQGVAYALGVGMLGGRSTTAEPLFIHAIRPGMRGGGASFLPLSLYQTRQIVPGGIFALDEQTDSRYIFVPLEFAQRLLNAGEKISALEVKFRPGISPEQGKQALIQSELLGELLREFESKTRFEQKETVYRMVAQEKWVIYVLLLFVVGIAALSLVGSVVMLVADKERDRGMLVAMGGGGGLLRQIFVWEGIVITALGVGFGLVLGVGFALAQQAWGIVPMAGENLLMSAYPVRVAGADLGWIAGGVLALGTLVSVLTVGGVVRTGTGRG